VQIQEPTKWARVIDSIKNPLKFFSLVFIGSLLMIALSLSLQWPYVVAGFFAVIIGDIGIVTWLVAKHPESLSDVIRDVKITKQFINSKAFQDAVGDVVRKMLEKKDG
jgi:hypothetical protein